MRSIAIICSTKTNSAIVVSKTRDDVKCILPDNQIIEMSYQAMQQTTDDPYFDEYPSYAKMIKLLNRNDGIIRNLTSLGVYFGLPTTHMLTPLQQNTIRLTGGTR